MMFDWNFRVLLFTKNRERDRFQTNKFLIFRNGDSSLEVDLRFIDLSEGLDYVSKVTDIRELCIFSRGDTKQLNSLYGMRDGIVEGFGSMSEEKYWLAHEIFEDYWKHFGGDLSRFFHGIVLICVSLVHYQMGHPSNAIRIFDDGKKELLPFFSTSGSWSFSYPLDQNILNDIRELSIRLIQP